MKKTCKNILVKYSDFTNMVLKKLTIKLPKHSDINKYTFFNLELGN